MLALKSLAKITLNLSDDLISFSFDAYSPSLETAILLLNHPLHLLHLQHYLRLLPLSIRLRRMIKVTKLSACA